MVQHDYVMALDLPLPQRRDLPEDIQQAFAEADKELGMLPNVFAAFTHNVDQLRALMAMYQALMYPGSGLSDLEREMIAVAVSSTNHCYYCQVSHGFSVRALSGDPVLGELMVMNYRAANLSNRQRAMLDFAVKLTKESHTITEADRQALRDAGFSDRDIWDIANVAGFYNMTNRIASATNMQPNLEYHFLNRARS
jgi:uncharacterized peroxidase-related enzyme